MEKKKKESPRLTMTEIDKMNRLQWRLLFLRFVLFDE